LPYTVYTVALHLGAIWIYHLLGDQ